MTPQYFDAHSHLNFPEYDADRETVVRRMEEQSVGTITVGTDAVSSRSALDLAVKYSFIFASIGVHPADDKLQSFEVEKFESLIFHPKVVAVGECGLDYHLISAGDEAEKKRQRELFVKQIEFALKYQKPLMIHSRAAYGQTHEILVSYARRHGEKLSGNIHFFTGSIEDAKRFLELGFTLSVAGVATFAREYDEMIRFLPLSAILSETDAPFAAPEPWRGKRNEPAYVVEVVRAIARVRSQDEELVREALVENARRVFRLNQGVAA
ncbi:TatD family deoxyribonuclease [Patescibacteria group bacterium]|nr:MAG: TatD family deoxyribonuclease [Patescibacteria group bacterium]